MGSKPIYEVFSSKLKGFELLLILAFKRFELFDPTQKLSSIDLMLG